MQDSNKQKSINSLLRNYHYELDHAEQVKKLSLLIFDKTREVLHNFSERERDLIEAGALLHDIGYSVSGINHNKHSYNLISQNKIKGFNSEEIEVIANIAKYHRGKKPKKSHKSYSSLPDNTRQQVKKLSAIVRMADGLDRSHLNIVEDLDCAYDSFSRTLNIILRLNIPDCGPEIWAAEKKKDLFESEFGVRVIFRVINAYK